MLSAGPGHALGVPKAWSGQELRHIWPVQGETCPMEAVPEWGYKHNEAQRLHRGEAFEKVHQEEGSVFRLTEREGHHSKGTACVEAVSLREQGRSGKGEEFNYKIPGGPGCADGGGLTVRSRGACCLPCRCWRDVRQGV